MQLRPDQPVHERTQIIEDALERVLEDIGFQIETIQLERCVVLDVENEQFCQLWTIARQLEAQLA